MTKNKSQKKIQYSNSKYGLLVILIYILFGACDLTFDAFK